MESRNATGEQADGPSSLEILFLLAVALGVHLLIFAHAVDYWEFVRTWFDNPHDLRIVAVIEQRTWTCDPECPIHTWGYPWAIVAAMRVFRLSPLAALIAVSLGSCFPALWLVRRLYGGWVAGAVLAAGFTWIYVATYGGSDPLFLCLLYGAFALARKDRLTGAAAVASLSAMVRPIGAIAVALIAFEALARRQTRDLVLICVVTLGLLAAYLAPIVAIAHDPWVTVSGYGPDWFPRGYLPFVPFVNVVPDAIVLSRENPREAWTAAVCLVVILLGLWRLWRAPRRDASRFERLFATVYVYFFLSADNGVVAMWFPRYMLPVYPIVFRALESWIPRSRWLLWSVTLASAMLGAGLRSLFRSVTP